MGKWKGILYGSISAATYGLIPLFALPVLSKGVAFDSVLCYRFGIAVLALGGLMMLQKESFQISRKEGMTLIFLGLLFASSAMFLFWSYRLMAAGIASTILFLYPVFVALLMCIFFHEKISWITGLSILVALAGVAFLYWGDRNSKISIGSIFIVLLSALTYAVYLIVIQKSNVRQMSGRKLTFYSMTIAGLIFLIKAQFSGGLQILPDYTAFFNVAFLGIIPTVISCIAMVQAVHEIGSTNTAVLGAMEPLTAVCVGIGIFQEPFTLNLAVGIVLIIFAVTLIILSDRIVNIRLNDRKKR